MAPPTVEMLQRLAAHATFDEAVASLGGEGVGGGRILKARLSPLVQVVLAPNPSIMTGPGTNTYVVGSGPTVVIDPAVDDEEYIDVVEHGRRRCRRDPRHASSRGSRRRHRRAAASNRGSGARLGRSRRRRVHWSSLWRRAR